MKFTLCTLDAQSVKRLRVFYYKFSTKKPDFTSGSGYLSNALFNRVFYFKFQLFGHFRVILNQCLNGIAPLA